jgi:hypothetical protein
VQRSRRRSSPSFFGFLPFVFLRGFPALFAAGVALLALCGGRPRPWWSLGGAVVWLAGFFAVWVFTVGSFEPLRRFPGVLPVQDFFLSVVDPAAVWYGGAVSMLVALGLAIARQRIAAAVLLLSLLPWAVAALRYASSPGDRVLWLPYFGALVAAAVIGRRARKRPRSSPAQGPFGETPAG